MVKQRRWKCVACRHQVSLTAGTILHNTKTPLTLWFWAAYLMTTDKRGVSALLLQRQLGLRRYETAWMMLHKLRRAMVNAAREPLHGEVEVDDTWIGGPQPGIKGSRQLRDRRAVPVLVAVETRGDHSGRIRMVVLPNFTATSSGFHFPNSWPHIPLREINFAAQVKLTIGDAANGLCGGMSFTVADLHATLLYALGLDHEQLTYPHEGRADSLTDAGVTQAEVITELLA